METIIFLAEKLNLNPKHLKKIIDKAPYLYRDRKIPKPNGGDRSISIPYSELKFIQEKILKEIFYNLIKFPKYIHGGIPGKSIITNAQPHINKQYVINFDIKNFFPSIRIPKLRDLLCYFIVDRDFVEILIRLTTHNFCLPQGAPTSPLLSNLPFLDFDKDIQHLCNKNHLSYTRYFDDITISGKHANKFVNKVIKIIEQSGFQVNYKKINIQLRSISQYVTGIIVNKKLMMPQEEFINIQNQLDQLDKYGITSIKTDNVFKELDILNGKIAFLQQVNQKVGSRWRNKFNNIKMKINL